MPRWRLDAALNVFPSHSSRRPFCSRLSRRHAQVLLHRFDSVERRSSGVGIALSTSIENAETEQVNNDIIISSRVWARDGCPSSLLGSKPIWQYTNSCMSFGPFRSIISSRVGVLLFSTCSFRWKRFPFLFCVTLFFFFLGVLLCVFRPLISNCLTRVAAKLTRPDVYRPLKDIKGLGLMFVGKKFKLRAFVVFPARIENRYNFSLLFQNNLGINCWSITPSPVWRLLKMEVRLQRLQNQRKLRLKKYTRRNLNLNTYCLGPTLILVRIIVVYSSFFYVPMYLFVWFCWPKFKSLVVYLIFNFVIFMLQRCNLISSDPFSFFKVVSIQ